MMHERLYMVHYTVCTYQNTKLGIFISSCFNLALDHHLAIRGTFNITTEKVSLIKIRYVGKNSEYRLPVGFNLRNSVTIHEPCLRWPTLRLTVSGYLAFIKKPQYFLVGNAY